MEFDCDKLSELTDAELAELFNTISESVEAHNLLVEITAFFPTPNLTRHIETARLLAEALKAIPLGLWIDFFWFIRCDISYLANREKDNLRNELDKILDLLDAHLQMAEVSEAIGDVPADRVDEIRQDIADLKSRIQTADIDDLVADLQRIKDRMRLELGTLWTALQLLYHAELIDDLAELSEDALRPFIGQLIKKILEKLTTYVLGRKAAGTAAKKFIPYVGTVLTLIELIGFVGANAAIADLRGTIFAAYCCMTREYDRRNLGNPLFNSRIYYAWPKMLSFLREQSGVAGWASTIVRVENFLRCAYPGEDDECEWGERCKIPFTDGSRTFTITLAGPLSVPPPDDITALIMYWWDNRIDDPSIPSLPCYTAADGRSPIMYMITTRVSTTSMMNEPPYVFFHSTEYINGARVI